MSFFFSKIQKSTGVDPGFVVPRCRKTTGKPFAPLYKNKYHEKSLWNGAPPPFRNLMVNVLFTYPPSDKESDPAKRFPIVGERQLTTIESVKLKKVQHKVYELLRAWEGGRDNKQAYEAILNSVCKAE